MNLPAECRPNNVYFERHCRKNVDSVIDGMLHRCTVCSGIVAAQVAALPQLAPFAAAMPPQQCYFERHCRSVTLSAIAATLTASSLHRCTVCSGIVAAYVAALPQLRRLKRHCRSASGVNYA